MKPIFLNDWSESGKEGMLSDFEIQQEAINGAEILLASYSYQNYSGDAFVLFRKDGKLYEVNGSHCSCYGLEGQWSPEETNLDVLEHRLKKGQLGRNDYCGNEFAFELTELVIKLKSEG